MKTNDQDNNYIVLDLGLVLIDRDIWDQLMQRGFSREDLRLLLREEANPVLLDLIAYEQEKERAV